MRDIIGRWDAATDDRYEEQRARFCLQRFDLPEAFYWD